MAIKPFGNVFRMNLDSIANVVIKTRNDRVMVEMCCTKDVQKYHSFQFEEVVIKVAPTNEVSGLAHQIAKFLDCTTKNVT